MAGGFSAKVVSMTVRPSQVSHVCFEMGGVLGALNTKLGAPAVAFDFNTFWEKLLLYPTTDDPAQLFYDYEQISLYLFLNPNSTPLTNSPPLAILRGEAPMRAVLDNAIMARQNAYYAKYGNIDSIVGEIEKLYSLSSLPAFANNKPHRLDKLSSISEKMASDLENDYVADHIDHVVKTTTSVLKSHTSGGEQMITGRTAMDQLTDTVAPDKSLLVVEGGILPFKTFDPNNEAQSFLPSETMQEGTSGETIENKGTITQHQTITNTDYGYRHPFYEAKAQNERAQISLMDQKFAQFMYSQNLPNLSTVFGNERNSIDNNVYRLQIAYLNNFLMSPISGTVTGIYKNPGDAVRAGEPVIRVENNDTIFLVATLIYPGPIAISTSVTVQCTSVFGSSHTLLVLPGTVVAARGQGQENQWAVIIQCSNPNHLPLGYNFDYDDTTVTIN